MKKLLFLLLGLSATAYSVGIPIGTVQISSTILPTQAGGFNVATGTVNNGFNLPYISGVQCLHTNGSTPNQVVGTGSDCGAGGGGGGVTGAIVNNASQYSTPYYSFTGSSNTLSGLSAGTAGQVLTTQGASGPPTWSGLLQTQITATGVSTGTIASNFPVSLLTNVVGNLPVTNLNSGVNANNGTFWRGDGTWVTPASGGNPAGASNQFQFNTGGVFGASPDFSIHSSSAILYANDGSNPFSSSLSGYGMYLLMNGHLGAPNTGYGYYASLGNGIAGNAYGFISSFTATTAGTRYGAFLAATGGANNYGLWIDSGQVQINSSMTVSQPISVTAPGDGNIIETISQSTYAVVSSSFQIIAGHLLCSNSTNYTVGDCGTPGGTPVVPGGPASSVQFNNAGSFGGSTLFQFNGTSVTVSTSVTVNNAPSSQDNSLPGLLDVYSKVSTPNDGSVIFSVGNVASSNQLLVTNGTPTQIKYGTLAGNLYVGDVNGGFTDTIRDINATNNQINFYTGQGITGEMSLETGAGTGNNIVFMPGTVSEVVMSTVNVVISTGVTINTAAITVSTQVSPALDIYAGANHAYAMRVSTFTAGFGLAISTNGHVVSNGPLPTLSSCGTGSPSVAGDDFQGTITTGGGSPTACTMTFASTYGVGCTVQCLFEDNTASSDQVSSISPTAVTFTLGLTSTKIYYRCTGYGASCR